MRTSAAGSNPRRHRPGSAHRHGLRPGRIARGVTLLELLVVVTLMALASAGTVMALRDSPQHRLELEAQQLVPWLEAARVQARTRGVVVRWTDRKSTRLNSSHT